MTAAFPRSPPLADPPPRFLFLLRSHTPPDPAISLPRRTAAAHPLSRHPSPLHRLSPFSLSHRRAADPSHDRLEPPDPRSPPLRSTASAASPLPIAAEPSPTPLPPPSAAEPPTPSPAQLRLSPPLRRRPASNTAHPRCSLPHLDTTLQPPARPSSAIATSSPAVAAAIPTTSTPNSPPPCSAQRPSRLLLPRVLSSLSSSPVYPTGPTPPFPTTAVLNSPIAASRRSPKTAS